MNKYPLKRKKTIELDVCQGCGIDYDLYDDYGDASCYSCINCGKKFCYDCRKTKLTNFRYSLYSSGSDNGEYCEYCSNFLLETKDPLRLKYERMEELYAKSKIFYEKLNAEADVLSKEIEVMLEAMRMKKCLNQTNQ